MGLFVFLGLGNQSFTHQLLENRPLAEELRVLLAASKSQDRRQVAAQHDRQFLAIWDQFDPFDKCPQHLRGNAVKQLWEQRPRAQRSADRLATALGLDMSQHWRPTVRSYLGRVTKAHILAAVREACGNEPAERIAEMKKAPMAEAAEQLLGETDWLPPLLRTERPALAPAANAPDAAPEAFVTGGDGAENGETVFAEAAE